MNSESGQSAQQLEHNIHPSSAQCSMLSHRASGQGRQTPTASERCSSSRQSSVWHSGSALHPSHCSSISRPASAHTCMAWSQRQPQPQPQHAPLGCIELQQKLWLPARDISVASTSGSRDQRLPNQAETLFGGGGSAEQLISQLQVLEPSSTRSVSDLDYLAASGHRG